MAIELETEVVRVDYNNPQQASQLIELLDDYARDPMGGGEPLPQATLDNLAAQLASIRGAFSLLAYVSGEPAGFANCLPGFSTFQCQPLINIHDLAVTARFRGKGVARRLLELVEQTARERGCCKVTLEVLEGNHAAKAAYLSYGFGTYELDPQLGKAEFWQKKL